MAKAKLTPAMEQYMHFKRLYPDAILFFRMGDFYEMFYDDAKSASKILGLTLTARNHGKTSGEVPLAGIPYHSLENYLSKLIRNGQKVAICEQVEDPKNAKGVVKRDVVEVVSPGTALADSLLEGNRNNFLLGVTWRSNKVGLAQIDLSTGDFILDEMDVKDLHDELKNIDPTELLISDKIDIGEVEEIKKVLPNASLSYIEDWNFSDDTARLLLLEQFRTNSLKGFGCDDLTLGVCAGGAVVAYLRKNQKGAVDHINRVERRHRGDHAVIDVVAKRNLELVENQLDGGRHGSLVESLDETCTPMGARLLRQWLVQPLKTPHLIIQRSDVVEELILKVTIRERLRTLMEVTGDLERLMARICCQRANGRDIAALATSLEILPAFKETISNLEATLLVRITEEELPDTGLLVQNIRSCLVDDPPVSINEGGLIRDGFDRDIDEWRAASYGGKEIIAAIQTREREETGIASLKIGFNQVFGYYIEVSKANIGRVPAHYMRKQTLTNSERYITPELKGYEETVLKAEEKLKDREFDLFIDLRNDVSEWTRQIQQVARSIACVDVLSSFAESAVLQGYVRPKVDDSKVIKIKQGRHPVIEQQLRDGKFVANDVGMDSSKDQVLLITGPNMSGKSTIIRQVGIIVILAQIGSFVPAESAQIGVVDRIFTRVGASDNLVGGESTFMVEMNEAANILNNITERSLILMDELGRGTSTFDGLSIAWAIIEYLHNKPDIAPRTLFATHYHEMTELEKVLPRLKNYNVSVREEEGDIVFLHCLEEGGADRSYGINVAQMAGMPRDVVSRAKDILIRLEKEQINVTNLGCSDSKLNQNIDANDLTEYLNVERWEGDKNQLELFPSFLTGFVDEVKELDLDQLTPIDALVKMKQWQLGLKDGNSK